MRKQKKRVIQLSGVVLEEDSVSGVPVPGVHIYVPKAGRGTTTNGMGFFSMPVLEGDEIIISAVGYRSSKRHGGVGLARVSNHYHNTDAGHYVSARSCHFSVPYRRSL